MTALSSVWRALAAAVLLPAAFGSAAEVHFRASMPADRQLPAADVCETLLQKTSQILSRSSAGAAGVLDVLLMEPEISVGERLSTEGLVRDVTTLSGEFILTARNAVDGTRYWSVTVPLKISSTAVPEGGEALALAKAVKTSDAVFTRFVRTARQKVEEYYEEHCDEVLARAAELAYAGHEELAAAYLLGVPPSAPCFEDCSALIDLYRPEGQSE